MRVKIIKIGTIFFFISLMLPLFFSFSTYANAAYKFEHSEVKDDPLMIDALEGKMITWEIINMSGEFVDIFADFDVKAGDFIRFNVLDITSVYIVNVSKKYWGAHDFEALPGYYMPGFLLVPRDWGEIAIKYVVETSYYWGEMKFVDQKFEAIYQTEWWDWQMISTITLSFIMNETNYDISKYCRGDGILLSREISVNSYNGKYQGRLKIVLHSYSGFLTVSPWYYVIIGAIIFAIAAIIIITIALLIQRHKRIYREIDEI